MQYGDEYRNYVFGSFLNSINYNDIDILVLYDSLKISPKDIILRFNPIKKNLSKYYKKRIHCSYLNIEEEKEVDFISKNNCVEFHCDEIGNKIII